MHRYLLLSVAAAELGALRLHQSTRRRVRPTPTASTPTLHGRRLQPDARRLRAHRRATPARSAASRLDSATTPRPVRDAVPSVPTTSCTPAGTLCRGSTDACDEAETCTGVERQLPGRRCAAGRHSRAEPIRGQCDVAENLRRQLESLPRGRRSCPTTPLQRQQCVHERRRVPRRRLYARRRDRAAADSNGCTDDGCDHARPAARTSTTATRVATAAPAPTDDACGGGIRASAAPAPDCSDNNVCTDDSCDPATGCVNGNNTDPCSDSNEVYDAGRLQLAAACVSGPAPNCDDSNACTTDSCDPANGCQHDFLPNCQPCVTDADCQNGTRLRRHRAMRRRQDANQAARRTATTRMGARTTAAIRSPDVRISTTTTRATTGTRARRPTPAAAAAASAARRRIATTTTSALPTGAILDGGARDQQRQSLQRRQRLYHRRHVQRRVVHRRRRPRLRRQQPLHGRQLRPRDRAASTATRRIPVTTATRCTENDACAWRPLPVRYRQGLQRRQRLHRRQLQRAVRHLPVTSTTWRRATISTTAP